MTMKLSLRCNGIEVATGFAGGSIGILGLSCAPAELGWTHVVPEGSLAPAGTYDLVEYVEAPPPEPEPPSPEELRELMPALSRAEFCIMLDEVLGLDEVAMEDLINKIPDPIMRRRTRHYWRGAGYFRRTDPYLVAAIDQLLKKTPEEADAIWTGFAASLTA